MKRTTRTGKGKEGIVFIIDAVLAATIIVLGIILVGSYSATPEPPRVIDYTSQDIVKVLGNLRIHEYDQPYVLELINQSVIKYVNNTLLEQIGEFWATGLVDEARNLSRIILGDLVPKSKGVGIFVNDDTIYVRNLSTETTKRWRHGRIISGIAKDKPFKGTVSKAFLTAEPKKRTAYAFFGGYVGDGDIETTITLLPGLTNVTRMSMELDIGNNFSMEINGDPAGNYTTTGKAREADSWTVPTSYLTSFQEGNNSIAFIFPTDDGNYIGGGFIKVAYTSEGSPAVTPSWGMSVTETKMLPGIDGVINLYDAFSVPGNLTALEAYLHFEEDFFLMMVIGNQTVLMANESATSILLDDTNLSAQLDYHQLDGKTVPLRLRSSIDASTQGRGADVILITDLSGSMNWRIGYSDSTFGTIRACDDGALYSADTRRISLAKCLDAEFINIILNSSTESGERNRIGIVGYTGVSPDGIVSSTNLTNGLIQILGDIDGYPDTTSGGTCIACAITKAEELIKALFPVIEAQTEWLYTLDYESAPEPLNDSQNNTWMDHSYNDTSWILADTSIGFPSTDTVIGSTLMADLWEIGADSPLPVDFTSGLNSTANTFGIGATDDGWDWAGGIYDYANVPTFNGVVGGRLNIYMPGNSDPSGGYGILINITQEMIDQINNGFSLNLRFDYEWDGNDPRFESDGDHVWLKGRFHHPNGSVWYLGSELEGADPEADASEEISYADNPDDDFSGSFSQDLSGMVDTTGMYYLDLGAKLISNKNNEWGDVYYDNIDLSIQMPVGNIFFRKQFSLLSDSQIEDAFLSVYSDDRAEVWLNGNLVDNDTSSHTASYWNRVISVTTGFFRTGTNTVAVKVFNDDAVSLGFDLEMLINDSSRIRHILTMTDGIPGYSYSPLTWVCGGNSGDCNTGACDGARDSTITASCNAQAATNATIHSVGFGDLAACTVANETLYGVAQCGNGKFTSSSDPQDLLDFYRQLAFNIITQTFTEQTSYVEGGSVTSILYPDSYIRYTYTSTALPPVFGTTELTLETPPFGNNATIGSLTIPAGLTVTEGRITSYSGSAWTDRVEVRNALYPIWTPVFELDDWAPEYTEIGDPFHVMVAPQFFSSGSLNEFRVGTGLNLSQPTNGSVDDRLIFTVRFSSVVNYTQITSSAEGCVWTLTFEDGNTSQMPIPADYAGLNTCDFLTASYDTEDALQGAAYALFQAFDFDGDGKLFFNPEEVNLILDQVEINDVPSLWGPSVVEVRIWD